MTVKCLSKPVDPTLPRGVKKEHVNGLIDLGEKKSFPFTIALYHVLRVSSINIITCLHTIQTSGIFTIVLDKRSSPINDDDDNVHLKAERRELT